MRILHVVTLVSPDGAYGGPLRVALNLAAAMRERGHDVVVAAAARGWRVPPTEMDGVPLRLFPARAIPRLGHAGITSPAMVRWLRRHGRGFDVVHIHFARDLVAVPAALAIRGARRPLVLQTHGMIDAPGRPLASLLDVLAVRRILRGASRIAVLTDREHDDLTEVAGPDLPLVRLGNGVPLAPVPATPAASEEIVFLSRLQARKRPVIFVEMAAQVLEAHPSATFALVGPDEGQGAAVEDRIRALGIGAAVRYEGALPPESTGARLRAAAVLVLPAIGEVFPMAVLEALANGVPVVLGRSSGIAGRVEESGAGVVVDDEIGSYAEAVAQLLADPERRADAGRRAWELARSDYSMEAVASEAEQVYFSAIRPSGGTTDR